MNAPTGEKTPSGGKRKSFFREFLDKLRKRHIIETLAAFIGGGWLILEFVDRLLVAHYHFPDETIDLAFVTILAALICTILWRWFRGTEKRPGNVKVEVLLVPWIILTALCIDLNIVFDIAGISGKRWLIGIIALCLGIAWIIFKSLQWAAIEPAIISGQAKAEIEISPLAPAIPEKSIAVLPFVNISPEEGQDYFCDGMTEEIITDLSHVHDLLVISRSSAMTFKGTKKTIPEIARAVNVRYVLEGSVRKAGNNLRITAQLIDSSSDAHLWAEKYSGTLDDVFDIQEKVSRSIVDTLKTKLTPQDKERMIARPIDNAAAYDLHIRARYEVWRGTEEGLDNALALVKQALAIMGENEILYVDMSYIFIMYMDAGLKKDEGTFLKAEECIQKIFALNPDSAHGHYLRAMINRKRGNTQEAVREFKKSLALDPANPDSMMWLGWVYSHSGKTGAARPLVKRLLEIDPLTPVNHFFAAAVPIMEGQFDQALGELQEARRTQEANPMWLYWHAKCLAYSLRLKESRRYFDLIEKEPPATPWAQLSSFFVNALEKKKMEALQPISEGFKLLMKEDEIFPIWMAESYSLIDEKSEAIDWLENGINSGFINYLFLIEYDPFLANIRSEERFKKLMERVKYEWEHFEV
jgi:non-specific serine/threonine protein kinase